MNVSAKFDEFPPLHFQDDKKNPNKYLRMYRHENSIKIYIRGSYFMPTRVQICKNVYF